MRTCFKERRVVSGHSLMKPFQEPNHASIVVAATGGGAGALHPPPQTPPAFFSFLSHANLFQRTAFRQWTFLHMKPFQESNHASIVFANDSPPYPLSPCSFKLCEPGSENGVPSLDIPSSSLSTFYSTSILDGGGCALPLHSMHATLLQRTACRQWTFLHEAFKEHIHASIVVAWCSVPPPTPLDSELPQRTASSQWTFSHDPSHTSIVFASDCKWAADLNFLVA